MPAPRQGHPRSFGFLRLSTEPVVVRATGRDTLGTLTETTWQRHEWEAPDGRRISVDYSSPLIRRVSIKHVTAEQLTAITVGYGDTIRSADGRWIFEAVNPAGVPPLHSGCRPR